MIALIPPCLSVPPVTAIATIETDPEATTNPGEIGTSDISLGRIVTTGEGEIQEVLLAEGMITGIEDREGRIPEIENTEETLGTGTLEGINEGAREIDRVKAHLERGTGEIETTGANTDLQNDRPKKKKFILISRRKLRTELEKTDLAGTDSSG